MDLPHQSDLVGHAAETMAEYRLEMGRPIPRIDQPMGLAFYIMFIT